ncbi:MAG: alpha/beta hydrolase [Bacteroidota bacterium]
MKLRLSGNKDHVILWLHGFCLSSAIWEDLVPQFQEDYTSITLDLPGFGETPSSFFNDLPDLADQVYHQLRNTNVSSATLIGHSLGGYLCLEILRQRPDFCKGLVLFHANAFEDSEERKSVRQVYLDAFERFGGDFFLQNFHENLFYNKQHPAIKRLREQPFQISTETLQRYTQAMKDRGGYDELLKTDVPKLLISGAFDQSISSEDSHKMYEQSKNCELLVLSNSAHMGMLEEPKQAADAIRLFIEQLVKAS